MINYHILPSCIVLNFSGKTLSISKDDSRYQKVIDAIKADQLDTIPDLVDVEKRIKDAGLEYKDNLVYLNQVAMPTDLYDRVETFIAEGLPTAYLNKFWEKLKLNPSSRARQMLFKFLEHNGHPITPEGNFIAYRGITDEFKDARTGNFDNSIGSVCEMPRALVDDDPNNTCSTGLHVACYDYAKGFSCKTVEVEVDPRDVICVPNDYNGTKMRVCKFKVVRECEKILDDEIYEFSNDCSEVYLNDTSEALDHSRGTTILNEEMVEQSPDDLLTRFMTSFVAVANLLNCDPMSLTRDQWLKAAIENNIPRLNKTEINELGGFRHLKLIYKVDWS